MSALKSLSGPKKSSATDYEKGFVVDLGDGEITLQREGERISLKISEIDSITIATTSDGPFICDVWYVIHAGENSMTVPMGATGEKALLDYLLALPGYDSKLFIEAMSCTEDRIFPVWKRSPA